VLVLLLCTAYSVAQWSTSRTQRRFQILLLLHTQLPQQMVL
jgi:hypothetical protein